MARRPRSGLLAAGMVWLLIPAGVRAASIDLGSASGAPGDEVSVAVSLQTMGAMVVGTLNRIDFGRETPVAATARGNPDCKVNPAIDKTATTFRFLPLDCDPAADCTSVRALVLAFDNLDPIPDGSVLYTCRIAIAADAQPGVYALPNAEMSVSVVGGEKPPTSGRDGSVEVTSPPVAALDIGSVAAPAGTTVEFPVTFQLLTDPAADVVAVQNDIDLDAFTPVVALPSGRPSCTVNPAIDKEATSFVFLPLGCSPGVDCTGLRAFVLSAANTSPIPDAITLYSCQVAIAVSAPLGVHRLTAGGAVASGPDSELLPALSNDGAITVSAACIGDCNGDHSVAINELLLGVNIVAGDAALSACAALDANQDGTVIISELVQAVNNALGGCPM
jgi:hypothetical protein